MVRTVKKLKNSTHKSIRLKFLLLCCHKMHSHMDLCQCICNIGKWRKQIFNIATKTWRLLFRKMNRFHLVDKMTKKLGTGSIKIGKQEISNYVITLTRLTKIILPRRILTHSFSTSKQSGRTKRVWKKF